MPSQIIAYHYVASGHLFLGFDDEEPVQIGAGEVVLMPRNDRHTLGSAPGLKPAIIDHLIQPPDGTRPAVLQIGGSGEETHVICGNMGCEIPDSPLLAALPRVLRIKAKEGTGDAWFGGSFQHAAEELASGDVGSSTVLSELAELLFV